MISASPTTTMIYHGNLHPKSFHTFILTWGKPDARTVDERNEQLLRRYLGLALTTACLVGLAIGFSLS